ncbi:type II/IV secretion system ATPase TadZ/CpaE [alpha proteobacterium U9-1i]|nr:type II/IV secretion system ATPase TadZ/CpaE [alpha proteobacterium U9-1i]
MRLLVSRSRRNRLVAVAAGEAEDDGVLDLVTPEADAPGATIVALDVACDDEPPFDPPDADDDIFLGAEPSVEETDLPEAANDSAPEAEAETEAEAEPEAAPEPTHVAERSSQTLDEEPPFDAPDADDQLFASGSLKRGAQVEQFTSDVEVSADIVPQGPADRRSPVATERHEEARAVEQPIPAIKIYASWDREKIGETLNRLSDDPRMARADIEVERGGLDRAIARFSERSSPDLLILDTELNDSEMLAGLDRLAHVVEGGAKVIVVGGVNDIALLRELAVRGVSDYMVAPMRRDDLARAICALYTGDSNSRVIAVIGACGGVGASTIAHNLAWSIAERQESGATLIDLDLSFGTAAFSFKHDPGQTVVDVLAAPESADDSVLDQAIAKPTRRLRVLSAPASVAREYQIEPQALDLLIARARRTSPFVVLDLPHEWNSWVKHSLIAADDVVVVAGPDLASLRNTKNFLDLMRHARPHATPPAVALSMVGVPKRPEILAKDFAQSLGIEPAASFAFEPALHGMAAINGRLIGEDAPDSKAALTIDALAASLTGRRPVDAKRAQSRPSEFSVRRPAEGAPRPAPILPLAKPVAPLAPAAANALTHQPELPFAAATPSEALTLDRVVEAPPEPQRDYIEKARDAALAEAKPVRVKARRRRRYRGASYALAAALVLCALRVETDRHTINRTPQSAELMSLAVVTQAPAPASAPRNPDADYAAALEHLNADRAEAAVTLLRQAAESGHAMAQYRLALLYERGEGVGANMAQARAYTERAAASGNRMAMHNLGVYFAQGEGGPVDEAAAFRWFRQAAEFGVADSQYNLGVLYQRGRGVNEDKNEALFWFLLAARQGDTQATARITEIETLLAPADAQHARARADAFRPRAANALANGEPPQEQVASTG